MEHGIVIEMLGTKILVETEQNSCCDACAMEGACAIDVNTQKRRIWMENSLGARPGDEVELYISEKTTVFSSMLVYFFPIIMLVTGMVLGAYHSDWLHLDGDIASALLGGLFLIISFITIKIISIIIKKRNLFIPVLIRIIR
jgi:sigma-E factor negative regulatory protein RseC